jgi:hypothetical protein
MRNAVVYANKRLFVHKRKGSCGCRSYPEAVANAGPLGKRDNADVSDFYFGSGEGLGYCRIANLDVVLGCFCRDYAARFRSKLLNYVSQNFSFAACNPDAESISAYWSAVLSMPRQTILFRITRVVLPVIFKSAYEMRKTSAVKKLVLAGQRRVPPRGIGFN